MASSSRVSDVARMAGVSAMTVSRVLNENPHVSEDVRRKVTETMKQLNYQPNHVARSLRGRRTHQIGVIVPYLFDPFFALCAHGIATAAQQHGYSVLLSTSNEDMRAELTEATNMLRYNVEGLIVIPVHARGEPSPLLGSEFTALPIVTLGRPVEGSEFDSVLVQNQAGARQGTEHLIQLGHRRVAFVGLAKMQYTMRMRHLGYTEAMEAAGLTPQSVVVSDLEDTSRAMRKLFAMRHPPTALFCSNNLVTRRVLHSLLAIGIHLPAGAALVGFDDFDTADLLQPGITVIRQPVEELGRAAASMLFERLLQMGPQAAATTQMRPVKLIVRGSCGARPWS